MLIYDIIMAFCTAMRRLFESQKCFIITITLTYILLPMSESSTKKNQGFSFDTHQIFCQNLSVHAQKLAVVKETTKQKDCLMTFNDINLYVVLISLCKISHSTVANFIYFYKFLLALLCLL